MAEPKKSAKKPAKKAAKKQAVPTPAKQEVEHAYQLGLKDGKKLGRVEALDWLEKYYTLGKDRPDRDSPEAKACLQLTLDLAKHLRGE